MDARLEDLGSIPSFHLVEELETNLHSREQLSWVVFTGVENWLSQRAQQPEKKPGVETSIVSARNLAYLSPFWEVNHYKFLPVPTLVEKLWGVSIS